MTSSGTTAFNPTMGEATIYALGLCGIRPTQILQEHMVSARMAANLLFSTWSSMGVNLWKVDLVTTPLVAGQASYSVGASNIVMLDTYISTTNGSATIDRLILPISRTEYASYPNKAQPGFPTVFWQDRLLNPIVYLWPVPDGSQTALKYYEVVQIDDVAFTNGQTMDMPLYFQEAFALGLAYRLALTWAPQLVGGLKALADEAYLTAASQNIETSEWYIAPQTGGYYRN